MWFKKLIINLTIKILNKIKDVNFGSFDKAIDELLDKAIKNLKDIITKWDKIKEESKK